MQFVGMQRLNRIQGLENVLLGTEACCPSLPLSVQEMILIGIPIIAQVLKDELDVEMSPLRVYNIEELIDRTD